jgi:hypothetical protein
MLIAKVHILELPVALVANGRKKVVIRDIAAVLRHQCVPAAMMETTLFIVHFKSEL